MRAHRPEDWPRRLATYLAQHAGTPFAWGRHDCGTFAAKWLIALGYPDPVAGLAWQSPLGAARLMRDAGSYAGLIDRLLLPLGCERIEPRAAARGDVVLLPFGGRDVVGIITGVHAICLTRQGYAPFPYLPAVAAYSV